MGDTTLLIRLIAASVLIGLLAYCGAHVFQVWRRRNARPAQTGAGRSSLRKVAWVCLIAGLVLIPAAGVLREFTRSEGVLTGEELFVVRARDDLAVEWVQDGDITAAEEPLVRFGSRPSSARMNELRARLARAEAERDVLTLSPLTPDPDLTRRHQAVAQERAQIEQELGQTTTAADSASRDLTAQLQTKKETLARLERTLTERRKDLERANIRAAHHQELAKTHLQLLAKGTVTAVEYREQLKLQREAEAEVVALTQELKDGQAEKVLLQAHIAKLEANQVDPTAVLPTQIEARRARLMELKKQEAKLKAALDLDVARTIKLRDAELSQAVAKIRECEAGLAAMSGAQEARAPFSGRVAYRAPSPNAVRPGGALLVVGPEKGFLLTARMPSSEAVTLQDGSEVSLEVAADSPERRVPARFLRAHDLVHEPGQTAIQLECQPPPEVVRRLAEGEKLTVAFSWSPPLTSLWPFRAGLILTLAGVVGLVFPLRNHPLARSSAMALWRRPGPGVHAKQVGELPKLATAADDLMSAITDSDLDEKASTEVSMVMVDARGLADELDELCRQVVQQVNRTECPEQAAWLLAQLYRIRSTHRIVVQDSGALPDGGSQVAARADS